MADIRDIDHIVHQCIDFVRDGQDEPLESLELDALVRTALQRHEGLQLDLDCRGLQVGARRLGLLRLVRNLADNALAHGLAPVRVVTRRDGEQLRLSVEDHGRGIERQEWQRLIEPFERGNRARDGRGAGLGLAIVQRVASAHGAQVELRERRADRPFAVELCLPLTA
nr:ATP-binding protein [Solimonas sp. SE-A11]